MNDFWLTIAQLTINGIAVGAIYALVALGIVLIYKPPKCLTLPTVTCWWSRPSVPGA